MAASTSLEPTMPSHPTRPRHHWIAVASAEHVRLGRAQGFMQVCHGKPAPLRRVQPGDAVAYYSPSESFRGKDRLQAFTAAGVVRAGGVYPFAMGGGFRPHRRDVDWFDTQDAPIRELLPRLAFAQAAPNWGARMRFGLFEISAADMDTVLVAMGVAMGVAMRVATGSPMGAGVEAAVQVCT
jgi:EVE domain